MPETSSYFRNQRPQERALLVHVRFPNTVEAEDVEELRLLAVSAGALVIDVVVAARQKPDAATYVGKGKVEEIRAQVVAQNISLVVVNHALSPAQERNLEKAISCRVLDRAGLILDIFAQRARSHEGKLQVELAQLEHLSTRLVRGWTHLERQKGGIGLRGPGETQLETDRRLIAERIKNLQRRLEKVRLQRSLRRRARRKIPLPTVSLVGYTNAGKSSLFNALTGAGVYAADRLFATLDPTMRRIRLPGHVDAIVADTVGFIRHLPHDLVEAFHSTLEEVAQADLLLHVIDAHHPERQEYIAQVDQVLQEIDAAEVRQILIFNKIDLTGEAPHIERDADGVVHKVWLSARTGAGLDLLSAALAEYFRRSRTQYVLRLPPSAGRLRAAIYERLEVESETITPEGDHVLHLHLTPAQSQWLSSLPDFAAAYWLDDPAAQPLPHYRTH